MHLKKGITYKISSWCSAHSNEEIIINNEKHIINIPIKYRKTRWEDSTQKKSKRLIMTNQSLQMRENM